MDSTQIYPSLDDIMPETTRYRIPATLADDIRERYESLGDKYVTEHKLVDGRRINACMFKSSVQDALEEVVDAVFNTLVWIHKTNIKGEFDNDAAHCLMGLIEIYSLLKLAKDRLGSTLELVHI